MFLQQVKLIQFEFVEESFSYFGEEIEWFGKNEDEKGVQKSSGKVVVKIDPKYYRKTEVDLLKGDYSKAKLDLNWSPKVKFKELVKIMTKSDFNILNSNLKSIHG